jgi:alpha-glucuronidase
VTIADFEGQYPVLVGNKPLKGKLTKTKAGVKPYICVMSASANSQLEFTVSSKALTPGISVYDANTEEMLESTTGKNPAKLSFSLKDETTLMIAVFSSNNVSVGEFIINVK